MAPNKDHYAYLLTYLIGIDLYAFLQIFFTNYEQYASLPFHIAGESYGGKYAPTLASLIYKKNKELDLPSSSNLVKIDLLSVVLANSLTDPKVQFSSMAEFSCNGHYPLYDDPNGKQCKALKDAASKCHKLIAACDSSKSKLVCLSARLYCTRLSLPFLGALSDDDGFDALEACFVY